MPNFPESFKKVSDKQLAEFRDGFQQDMARADETARQLRKKGAKMPLPGQPDPLNIRFGIPSRNA